MDRHVRIFTMCRLCVSVEDKQTMFGIAVRKP